MVVSRKKTRFWVEPYSGIDMPNRLSSYYIDVIIETGGYYAYRVYSEAHRLYGFQHVGKILSDILPYKYEYYFLWGVNGQAMLKFKKTLDGSSCHC